MRYMQMKFHEYEDNGKKNRKVFHSIQRSSNTNISDFFSAALHFKHIQHACINKKVFNSTREEKNRLLTNSFRSINTFPHSLRFAI